MRIEIVIGALLATALWAVVELFYRPDASGLWEVVKLIVQFAGALVIAWLAVQWALVRFKSEKSWERQTTAYAEAVSSLRELDRILDLLYQDEIKARDFSEAYLAKLQKRRKKAQARFQEAAALATVILPRDISEILLKLEAELANGYYNSRFEELDSESGLVGTALKELVSKKQRYV